MKLREGKLIKRGKVEKRRKRAIFTLQSEWDILVFNYGKNETSSQGPHPHSTGCRVLLHLQQLRNRSLQQTPSKDNEDKIK